VASPTPDVRRVRRHDPPERHHQQHRRRAAGASSSAFWSPTPSGYRGRRARQPLGSRADPGQTNTGAVMVTPPAGLAQGPLIIAQVDGGSRGPVQNGTHPRPAADRRGCGRLSLTAPATAGAGLTISVTTRRGTRGGSAAASTTSFYLDRCHARWRRHPHRQPACPRSLRARRRRRDEPHHSRGHCHGRLPNHRAGTGASPETSGTNNTRPLARDRRGPARVLLTTRPRWRGDGLGDRHDQTWGSGTAATPTALYLSVDASATPATRRRQTGPGPAAAVSTGRPPSTSPRA
jgi:hypothetical protein